MPKLVQTKTQQPWNACTERYRNFDPMAAQPFLFDNFYLSSKRYRRSPFLKLRSSSARAS